MFLRIKQIFWLTPPTPEMITDISDALSWIKTYRRAHDFDTAIFATKELILKNKTGITYYEEVLKKVSVLENSNIEKIVYAAMLKRKKIRDILEALDKELIQLERILSETEKEKMIVQKKEEELIRQGKFKVHSQEIQELIGKKEYARALSFAKKVVSDFPQEKGALSMLTRVQKLHETEKLKQEKEQEKTDKLKNIFQEVGMEVDALKKKSENGSWQQVSGVFAKMKSQGLLKKEHIKRQKALKDIERLLVQSGTIDNVTEKSDSNELFSIMHSGLTKDLSDFSLHGFDFYGRILGKDKIVWDTFGYYKEGNRTLFYIGDATGHGVQAGFTVALLSKLFFEFSKKIRVFQDFFVTLNNELKQKLKGRIFVTSVFFELDATNNRLSFIGAGHDPMFLYRKSTRSVEKIIPGGLALGVRLIQNTSSVKTRDIKMENGDILFGYTDGIIEVKDSTNDMYGLERMEKTFAGYASKYDSPKKIYDLILKDIDDFRGVVPFEDDVSLFLFARNTEKDLVSNKTELESILKEMDIKKSSKDINFANKTKQEVVDALKKERHEKELKIRLFRLDALYKMSEFTKLKQEIYMYFRDGYVHDKMRFYLEKAIENEHKSIIKKQDEKLKRRYDMLEELYKKGEHEVVIKEVIDILFKNGKI